MKKALLFLFAGIFFLNLSAQDSIVISEEVWPFKKGKTKAFKIAIPEANYKDVAKEWRKLLREYSQLDYEEEEIIAQKTAIPPISPIDTFSIWSASYESNTGTNLLVGFFQEDKAVAFDSLPELKSKTLIYLSDFAHEAYRNKVKEQLKNAESDLESLKRDLENLYSELDKHREDISKNEHEIEYAQKEIEFKEKDQERQKDFIEEVKEDMLETNRRSEEYKDLKKELNKLERDLNKTIRKTENIYDDIIKMKSDILESKRAIKDNFQAQLDVKEKIKNQEIAIQMMEEKLNGIKDLVKYD